MRLEHHLVGGYVRYISPHIIVIIILPTVSAAGIFPFPRIVMEDREFIIWK